LISSCARRTLGEHSRRRYATSPNGAGMLYVKLVKLDDREFSAN
jgi:hypothetical protein